MNAISAVNLRASSPLIILGMHRSGTTMLTRMLDVCGLFVGRALDENHEPRLFRDLNDQALSSAGGSWERPEPYLAERDGAPFAAETANRLKAALGHGFQRRFLTLPKRAALLCGQPLAWGWKDPRTCLTLPHWLDVFPGARVVHIVRHPLDVAISLARREAQQIARRALVTDAVRDLDYSLRLWETYVREGLRCRALGDRYLEMRFEDLLAGPGANMRTACDFAGLSPRDHRFARAVSIVDGDRQRRFAEARYAPWQERLRDLPGAVAFGYA